MPYHKYTLYVVVHHVSAPLHDNFYKSIADGGEQGRYSQSITYSKHGKEMTKSGLIRYNELLSLPSL